MRKIERERQKDTHQLKLSLNVSPRDASGGIKSKEQMWHEQQRAREAQSSLSIQTCVAPLTIMLHPEVRTNCLQASLSRIWPHPLFGRARCSVARSSSSRRTKTLPRRWTRLEM